MRSSRRQKFFGRGVRLNGDLIRAHRSKSGLSQEEFASQLKIGLSTLKSAESGNPVEKSTYLIVAAALGEPTKSTPQLLLAQEIHPRIGPQSSGIRRVVIDVDRSTLSGDQTTQIADLVKKLLSTFGARAKVRIIDHPNGEHLDDKRP